MLRPEELFVLNKAPIRILLVEDDLELRGLLEELLIEEGYQVLVADSGERAMDIASNNTYDLVVTDVKLGGIDGLDTLAELKKSNSELQSLVITGYATEADSVRAISLGVGDYIKKPFKVHDLLRAVAKLVEELHREREQATFYEGVLRTVLWAFEMVLEKCGNPPWQQDPLQFAEFSEKLAQKAGLSLDIARKVRIAVLAAVVSKSDLDSEVEFLYQILPERSVSLLQFAKADENSENLEQRLVSSTLRAVFDCTLSECDLEEKLLGTASEQAEENGTEIPSTEQASGKLLALVKAFEISGDLEGANLALDRLSAAQSPTVQASLIKARLAWQRGSSDESKRLLESAHQKTKDLSRRSRLELEGGLLLNELGAQVQAERWLKGAVSGYSELQNTRDLARARLALASIQEDPEAEFEESLLQPVLSPGNLEDLLGSAGWLYPYLLRVPSAPLVDRALQRISRDLPTQISSYLQGAVAETATLRALQIISEVGLEGYDDLLQELALGNSPKVGRLARDLMTGSEAIHIAPVLRIYSLGAMTHWLGDKRVPDQKWTGRKPSYLLTYLAQTPGIFHSRDHIIELFWEGSARGNKSLNQALVTIRNTLRAPDWPEKLDFISRRGTTVGINPDHTVWHDAVVVRQALKVATQETADGNIVNAAQSLEQALELDRGEYLEGCYDDWALSFRESLKLELAQGLCSLAEIRLEQSRYEDALAVCGHLLERDPLYERAVSCQMKAFTASEQSLEAIKVFEKFEKVMKRELDLEPGLSLVKLYHLAKMKM